jgi:signal transduction histidine kinase
MTLNSLAFRLFASAAVLALVVLPIAAFVLVSVYRNTVERSFDARLNVYLTNLVANAVAGATEQPISSANLGSPRFTLPFSGWYWQITSANGDAAPIATSSSLLDNRLTLPSEEGVAADSENVRRGTIIGPESQLLRILEREITLNTGEAKSRFSYAVAGDSQEVERAVSEFRVLLVAALTVLGLGLVAATILQVRYGLLPLRVVSRGLADIRSGNKELLEGDFPAEIVPLQNELNALLQSNRAVVERARTHVGNLAHALKTPLSVVTNEARGARGALARKVVEQAELMRNQVDHHLERARMAARAAIAHGPVDAAPGQNYIEQSCRHQISG